MGSDWCAPADDDEDDNDAAAAAAAADDDDDDNDDDDDDDDDGSLTVTVTGSALLIIAAAAASSMSSARANNFATPSAMSAIGIPYAIKKNMLKALSVGRIKQFLCYSILKLMLWYRNGLTALLPVNPHDTLNHSSTDLKQTLLLSPSDF